ncbi:hypothetical protein GGS20DRAFT_586460 [Poronia punctata]|nr:hypothetical protein GGS20DRAFT_586460 [Poronia punctata]
MASLPDTVFSVAIALILVTALAVSMRIWDRVSKGGGCGWDDGLLIFSWILSIGLCSNLAAATKHGLGTHRSDVSHLEHRTFLKHQLAMSVCYSTGITSAKASFAVLYLRLFPVNQYLVIMNKAIIIFLLLQAIEESFITLFHCSPVEKSWMSELEGHCLGLKPLWYSTFAFNFATDLVLFTEPIVVTWRLQMPLLRRIAINVMLSLGLFVTIISIVRLKYVITIGNDDTYELAESLTWSAAEFCSLIICSCVPSFRHIALKIPCLRSVPQQQHFTPIRSSYIRARGNTNPFGSTTQTTAVALRTLEKNEEKDDEGEGAFFPHHTADRNGAIMVTREVIHDVQVRKGGGG